MNNETNKPENDNEVVKNTLGAKQKNNQPTKKIKILIFLVALLITLFVLIKTVLIPIFGNNKKEELQKEKEVIVSVDDTKQFKLPKPKEFKIETEATIQPENKGFIGGNKNQEVKVDIPVLTKSTGSMVVKTSNTVTESRATGPTLNNENKIGNNKDMFTAGGQTFSATSAVKSRYNPNLLLEQGTYIPCVLRQKLISNIGGQISCTIAENVLSKNGMVTLIEKGSKVIGMYQSGGVSHGSDQIFVVWQEIRTPNNIVINVNSGSTDELGANGLTGWTDNHFWKRFGNAILVSMIMDISNSATTQLQKTDSRDYLQSTQSGSSDLAKSILEQQGDIKPTLYKNQGDKVGVFVARDIDFSTVYKLSR